MVDARGYRSPPTCSKKTFNGRVGDINQVNLLTTDDARLGLRKLERRQMGNS